MAEFKVPVVGGGVVTIDTDKIPERVYGAVIAAGLKALVNGGASKITKGGFDTADAYKEARLAKAIERVAAMLDDSIVIRGAAKSNKASGAVMTEARRLAKALIKDAMKAAGLKVSHVEASEITKAANALLETDQGKDILAQATANIEERSKAPQIAIDVKAMIHESPKLVAKAEKAKAEKKSQLSAKQAGLPKKAKGDQPTAH